MQRNVELLLGRLATDPAFRHRFLADPCGVLAELRESGLEITDVERDALAATDAQALHDFAGSLDRRLRRATRSHD
jgi:hypothetical protein